MSANRIVYILLHTWYHFIHSMETWVDIFWNTTVNLLIFIFIAKLIAGGSAVGVEGAGLILGMVFWNAVWVGQYNVTIGALWEMWSKSFNTLFITPLTMEEFIVGQMISGALKSIIAVVISALVAYWLTGLSVITLGWMLPVYVFELLAFSWGIGLMVLALIMRLGTDAASLSWSLVFLVQPFGGVFYAVTVLPDALQKIAALFPSTYIFAAIRAQYLDGVLETGNTWRALGLDAVWILLGYIALRLALRQTLTSGAFARLSE
ncbi:ABC transporter permease [Patescibacteria group bacterium]|nr:ABC transporter permease [Patescibacteria group bacterium]